MEFYPRDATLSMALYLSVCVCRKSVFYRNTKWLASSSWVFLTWRLRSTSYTLAYKEIPEIRSKFRT